MGSLKRSWAASKYLTKQLGYNDKICGEIEGAAQVQLIVNESR